MNLRQLQKILFWSIYKIFKYQAHKKPQHHPLKNAFSYKLGPPAGLFIVKGLINDPMDSFLAYLFTLDKYQNKGIFGVFKIDFTSLPPKYVYTALTMSTGSSFSVNSIIRTSKNDANDFYFAGKFQNFTDGTTTETFPTVTGYIMKGITSDSTKNCLNFVSGYSLSL